MPESMSISVNGQSQVPPGFRFHPTEEELLLYYLRKKVSYEKIDLDVIREVDLNKLEPWDIQEKCKIGTAPQNDWYFFSHKDKKYPTGTRTNRATAAGFWKATGRDKLIFSKGQRIGMRKTLVFYKGRAPRGQKSDWIMHEYRLDDINTSETNIVSSEMGDAAQEEGWVVCRTFKKNNHLKDLESPLPSSIAEETERSHLFDSCDEGALVQILHQMGKGCKEENYEASNYNSRRYAGPFDADINNIGSYHERFMKLPSLDSPKSSSMESHQNNNKYNDSYKNGYHPIIPAEMAAGNEGSFASHKVNDADHPNMEASSSSRVIGGGGLTNWATMDRMVAFQLNGQSDASKQLACFNDLTMGYCTGENDLQLPTLRSSSTPTDSRVATYITNTQDFTSEIDLWNFAPSAAPLLSTSETICHVSKSNISV